MPPIDKASWLWSPSCSHWQRPGGVKGRDGGAGATRYRDGPRRTHVSVALRGIGVKHLGQRVTDSGVSGARQLRHKPGVLAGSVVGLGPEGSSRRRRDRHTDTAGMWTLQ